MGSACWTRDLPNVLPVVILRAWKSSVPDLVLWCFVLPGPHRDADSWCGGSPGAEAWGGALLVHLAAGLSLWTDLSPRTRGTRPLIAGDTGHGRDIVQDPEPLLGLSVKMSSVTGARSLAYSRPRVLTSPLRGGVGPDLGQASDSGAVVGMGQGASHRSWALRCIWLVAGLFLSPRLPGWLCQETVGWLGLEKNWVLTLRMPPSLI